MWWVRCLLFLRQTGSRRKILEVCEFRFWQFRDFGGHIFPRIVAKIRPELKRALLCSVEIGSIKCNLQRAFVIAHERMKRKPKAEFGPV